MADQGSSDSFLIKVLGGVFATVVAPILVAVGLKFTDKVVPAPDPAAGAANSAATPASDSKAQPLPPAGAVASVSGTKLPDSSKPPAEAANKDVATAGPAIRLFNGQSLRGFYTYLGPPHKGAAPLGKSRDPQHVFSVQDGAIRISGQIEGGLVTAKEYENYRLTVVYRWGEQTWPPREKQSRKSGVLLHCSGDDGEVNQRFMRSIVCRIQEGDTGSLHPLGGGASHPLNLTAAADPLQPLSGDQHTILRYQYRPGAPLTTFSRGELIRLGRPPKWRDVKGFHGRKDVELAHGEWNTLECTCLGDSIAVRLNGKLVNEARTGDMQGQSPLVKGKIMLQSEKAEVFFREIVLQPLQAPGRGAQ